MKKSDAPVPDQGILVTHLVVAADIATTSHFYSELLGGATSSSSHLALLPS